MVKTVMTDWDMLIRRQLLNKHFKKGFKVNAFIQARQGSTRLPNKIYKEINGAPMLYHTINMAKRSRLIDGVIVVSPQRLPSLPEGIEEFVFDGLERDVLGRYAAALKAHPCDYVVRLTSDCPILDFHLIDLIIAASLGHDYGSNVLVPSFPDGMDTEVISKSMIEFLDKTATEPYDREHVTTLIRNSPEVQFAHSLVSVQCFKDQSYIKVSVDTEEDFKRVCEIEKELCLR